MQDVKSSGADVVGFGLKTKPIKAHFRPCPSKRMRQKKCCSLSIFFLDQQSHVGYAGKYCPAHDVADRNSTFTALFKIDFPKGIFTLIYTDTIAAMIALLVGQKAHHSVLQ